MILIAILSTILIILILLAIFINFVYFEDVKGDIESIRYMYTQTSKHVKEIHDHLKWKQDLTNIKEK